MNDSLLIVISPTEIKSAETIMITKLFENGLTHFHLRKPLANKLMLSHYLDAIPSDFHNRIILHNNFDLCKDYNLKGIHLNETFKTQAQQYFEAYSNYSISTSCHNTHDIIYENNNYAYYFLSPIFDSISKPDLTANFNLSELKNDIEKISTKKIIALGGITIDTLPQILDLNFAGIAVLGGIWQQKKIVDYFQSLQNLLLHK